jgi:hypothetical protein
MTSLEQLHQRECNDETDRCPFQASQNGVKHPGLIVAQATVALNSRKGVGLPLNFWLGQSTVITDAVGCKVVVVWPFSAQKTGFVRWKCVDCNPAICLGSPP